MAHTPNLSPAVVALVYRDLPREAERQFGRGCLRPTVPGEAGSLHLYRARFFYSGLGGGRGSLQFCGVAGVGSSYALEHPLTDENNELDFMKISEPNKPDAVNPAMTLRLAIQDQWRRVTDLERWAAKLTL